MAKAQSASILQLKLSATLQSSNIKDIRKLEVPSDYSFYQLRCYIGKILGLTNGKNHYFTGKHPTIFKNVVYVDQEPSIANKDNSKVAKDLFFNEKSVKIGEYFVDAGSSICYTFQNTRWMPQMYDIYFEKQKVANQLISYPISWRSFFLEK